MTHKRETRPTTKQAFQVGDPVKLRSGGPVMTVIGGSELDAAEQLGVARKRKGVWVRCAWFDGKKPLREDFPTGALEPAGKEGNHAVASMKVNIVESGNTP